MIQTRGGKLNMKFSVIIPVFRVEAYLRECIDSVLLQTYQDFELILVDDGSPDGCPAICDEYAEQDERIRVIHKPNGGLVSARQEGVHIARGDYVVCVDADDYIKPAMLEKAAAVIEEGDPDVIAFGARYFDDKRAWDVHEPAAQGWYDRPAIEKTIFPLVLTSKNMTYVFHFLCGKAIRRSLYLPHQMNVDRRISLGEDVACLMPVYMDTKKMYISHESMYCVRQREISISRRFSLEQFPQLIVGIGDLRKLGSEPVKDFQAQVDRYTMMVACVQLENAVEYGAGDQLDSLRQYVRNPVIWSGIQNAVYADVSASRRIKFWLLRHGMLSSAYHFIRLCKSIRRVIKKK